MTTDSETKKESMWIKPPKRFKDDYAYCFASCARHDCGRNIVHAPKNIPLTMGYFDQICSDYVEEKYES